MSGPDATRPSRETRDEEQREARKPASPGREPTADEEEAADAHEPSTEVAEHEQEMNERGARQEGEGRLP